MAMSAVYTNFGGQLVHEMRGAVETAYISDTLGSVMMCRDANGNTTYTADYWPYGEVASSTGTNLSPWGFVGALGYYTDAVPGSLYVRARIYLPSYGRWATVDPLWPGTPAFGYASSSPTVGVDPAGLQPSKTHPKEWPKWHDCISKAIKHNCEDLGISNSLLYAWVWCIIDGESSWDPDQQTPMGPAEIAKDPHLRGQHACGLMQLIGYYKDRHCREAGYPEWKTDPCENIGCGINDLCNCLRNIAKAGHAGNIRMCSDHFRAIEQPPGAFDDCMQKNFPKVSL